MAESKLRELSTDFAVKVIKLCDNVKGHYSLVNQLERSSTSIGANIHEANYAHSKADFVLTKKSFAKNTSIMHTRTANNVMFVSMPPLLRTNVMPISESVAMQKNRNVKAVVSANVSQ